MLLDAGDVPIMWSEAIWFNFSNKRKDWIWQGLWPRCKDSKLHIRQFLVAGDGKTEGLSFGMQTTMFLRLSHSVALVLQGSPPAPEELSRRAQVHWLLRTVGSEQTWEHAEIIWIYWLARDSMMLPWEGLDTDGQVFRGRGAR